MRKYTLAAMLLAAILLFGGGCVKRYEITLPLEEAVPQTASWGIGTIADELPTSLEPQERPTREHIDNFKAKLHNLLSETDEFSAISSSDGAPQWEVQGAVTYYEKGNGVLRFFINAGHAYLTVELMLVDNATGEVAMRGRFRASATSCVQGTDDMFNIVAADFVRAFKRQQKKLLKQ